MSAEAAVAAVAPEAHAAVSAEAAPRPAEPAFEAPRESAEIHAFERSEPQMQEPPATPAEEPVRAEMPVEAPRPERSQQTEMFTGLDLTASGLVMIETDKSKARETTPVVEEVPPPAQRARRPRPAQPVPAEEGPLVQIETSHKGTGTD